MQKYDPRSYFCMFLIQFFLPHFKFSFLTFVGIIGIVLALLAAGINLVTKLLDVPENEKLKKYAFWWGEVYQK